MGEDFYNIGIRSPEDFKGKDPQDIYEKICVFQKAKVDRCVLYVCRLAVYFAENDEKDPELLKWWNWSDKNMPQRSTFSQEKNNSL